MNKHLTQKTLLLLTICLPFFTNGIASEIDPIQLFKKNMQKTPEQIQKITVGLTNQNFSISAEGKKYFVRIGSSHADLLYISRDREKTFYQIGESLGVAPPSFFFDIDQGCLITEFIPNAHAFGKVYETWTGDRDQVIEKIVQLMKRVHSYQSPTDSTTPYYRRILDRYFQICTQIGVDSLDNIRQAYALTQQIQRPVVPEVLCHHDWFWENILFDEHQLWLIDWEYADWDDPMFDLACFCIEHALNYEERTLAFKAYNPEFSDHQRHDFEIMCMFYSLKTFMWEMIQKKMTPDMPFDLGPIAARHLNIFWQIARVEVDFSKIEQDLQTPINH